VLNGMPSGGAEPELACVVLSLRDQPEMVDAVASLRDQSEAAHVVVVNSGGGDPTARLRDAGLEVPVFNVAERLFAGAARNVGIRRTRSPYIAFLAADCTAEPGWVAARLREHRQGAAAVAGVLTNSAPDNRTATAAFLLLHHRMSRYTPPQARLLYGLSYDRRLFERFGMFREDLRAGEDTEFNARLAGEVEVAWTPDVRTAHRNPTAPGALLRDLYARGRRRAATESRLSGSGRRLHVATRALWTGLACMRHALRTPDEAERALLMRGLPLVPAGALIYAAGALSAGRVRRPEAD
jgi:GT2 family glycosyltransferase